MPEKTYERRIINIKKKTSLGNYYTHATHSNSCLPISRTRSMGNER